MLLDKVSAGFYLVTHQDTKNFFCGTNISHADLNECPVFWIERGFPQLFGIHFTEGEVRGYRDVAAGNSALRHQMFLGLMNEGFLTASNLVGSLSTEMDEGEIDAFLNAFKKVLARQI